MSAIASTGAPTLRESLFFSALAETFRSRSEPDEELILALGGLWGRQASAEPSRAFARAWSESRRGSFPSGAEPALPKLLFWMAQTDGFLCTVDNIERMAQEARIPQYHRPLASFGALPAAPAALAELARGPYVRVMGLLLNEARPAQAALWPIACAVAGASSSDWAKCAAAAPALSPKDGPARDALLALACAARDARLLDMALGLRGAGEPTPAAIDACCSELLGRHANAAARKALGLDKEPALEPGEAARRLCAALGEPAARAVVDSACKERLCLPEELTGSGWEDAAKAAASKGAKELTLDSLLALAARAASLAAPARPSSGSGAALVSVDGRGLSARDLDELAQRCVKRALAPRSVALGPDSPPLAYRLLELLPDAGASTQAAILKAMGQWCEKGFGRAELAWRRSASGHTQSIGSAIASLPKTRDPSTSFEPLATRWLCALASQGFDFEAKATPKSKSLGERLRGTASLKAFWPLVEAKIISCAATTAPSRPSRSL